MIEQISLKILRNLDPELAHKIAIAAVKNKFFPRSKLVKSDRLKCSIAGITIPNPIGLAAGFDKNAEALNGLSRSGFGFVEVGAATPLPQQGNKKPRLFRLSEDKAAINRFGFNNDGMRAIAKRLKNRPTGLVTGLNLGANKATKEKAVDFIKVLVHCGPFVDFATVNVSSPNTKNLRDLQEKTALRTLLTGVMEACKSLKKPIPIFLKIAPDLDKAALYHIAEIALEKKIDAIIATNTTLSREGLKSVHQIETGGLSGRPLFKPSTRILAQLASLLNSSIPLIGVGGIASAQDAYDKICAGASAVQLYTALIYHGFSFVDKTAIELDGFLKRDGYENISAAVGSRVEEFL